MERTFNVKLLITIDDEHRKKEDVNYVDDAQFYVEQEIGWLSQSFEGLEVVEINENRR